MADDIPLTRRGGQTGGAKKKATTTTPPKKRVAKISEANKNGTTKKSTIEFDGDLYIQMKVKVAERGLKMRDYIQNLIRADLKKDS